MNLSDPITASVSSGSQESILNDLVAAARTHLAAPNASSSAFFERLLKNLLPIDHNDLVQQRLECLLNAAQYFYVSGEPFKGIPPARAAVALCERSGLPAMLRKSLSFLAIMYADTWNLPLATESCAQALELAQDQNDLLGECTTWNTFGVALMYSAQYYDATRCFEHAIHLSLAADTVGSNAMLRENRINAYANIAVCCLNLGDSERGLRAIENAVSERGEPQTPSAFLHASLHETHFVRLLLAVGNVSAAGSHCERAKQLAMRSRTTRADIPVALAEGLFQVHSGLTDLGLTRLHGALEKAHISRPFLRETLTCLVKANEMAGNTETALNYLHELLEHTRKSQQESALNHLELAGEWPNGNTPTTSATAVLEHHEAALRGKLAERELVRTRIEILERLAVAAELRDDSTGEHSYRVGKLAALLAAEYGCDEDTVFILELAARLHDIGKIGIPDAILLKPGRLNEAEMQIMRAHTIVGSELLARSAIPEMRMAEDIARYHHEWWNGNGYPTHLSGNAIPLAARITALADVFDALTHKRPYKEAWPVESALAEIASLRGQQFDPDLTDLFLRLMARLGEHHLNLDKFLGQSAGQSPFLAARSRIWESLQRGEH